MSLHAAGLVSEENSLEDIMRRYHNEFAQHIASVRHADVAQIQELKNKLREALRRASLQSITGTVKVDGVRDVACVIDSISAPFAARYITQGQFGGQTAARKLLATIKNSDYLDEDGAPCSLSVFVFINAKALYVSAEDALTVHDFIAGFNQADSQTFMVDIGEDQAKMRSRVEALVQKGLSSSDTWKVVLGFADDDYGHLLESLDDIQREDKLIVLRTSSTLSSRLKKLDLSTIKAPPGIFEAKSIAASAGASDASEGRSDALGWTQTVSPPSSPVRSRPLANVSQRWLDRAKSETGPKYLNPNIPTWENNPPPCNVFYLLGHCKNGDSCPRGHDYILRDGDAERMKVACKKRPCDSVTKGAECTWGEGCLFGHACPFGPECRYLRHGKCQFGGADMHVPLEL